MQDLNLILAFIAIVVVMLGIDLFVVGKKAHAVSNKEAVTWSIIWIGISFLFAGYIYLDQGLIKSTEFLTAYMIEKALSVDNLFVFILVFNYFKVPEEYKHKVLFWGIMGAIVLRAIFIFSGVGLINLTYFKLYGFDINVVLTLFGAFLLYAGIKSGIEVLKADGKEEDEDFSKSPGAKFIKWAFKGRVTDQYDGNKFFTKRTIITGDMQARGAGSRIMTFATPLLVVVGVIEFTDLLFAVDSIPAIFSVSKDPFILYSSNIFAILGLRTLYFLLNNFIKLFRFLPYGLALILSFIGIKMVINPFMHISSVASLIVVFSILVISTLASVFIKEREDVSNI